MDKPCPETPFQKKEETIALLKKRWAEWQT
jgi:hypothetical protein